LEGDGIEEFSSHLGFFELFELSIDGHVGVCGSSLNEDGVDCD
jgi:hypothetical protein